MTKKDFEFLANTMLVARPVSYPDGVKAGLVNPQSVQWEYTVRILALRLQASNKRFDNARFLNACGVMT